MNKLLRDMFVEEEEVVVVTMAVVRSEETREWEGWQGKGWRHDGNWGF